MIYFVTTNRSKFLEASMLLRKFGIEIAQRAVHYPEIQAETLKEVVSFAVDFIDLDTFIIEDSGLFIHALRGFPGVYSNYVFKTIGLKGILSLMPEEPRDAHFESCLLFYDGTPRVFIGSVSGRIAREIRGDYGFGYDPIFIPDGWSRTFGEVTAEVKNQVSHRSHAFLNFAQWYVSREGEDFTM